MIKTKDGYVKLIGTTYSGNVSRVLLSNGGDHILGNSSGNIPLNNGTVNTNLNADMLDGLHIHAGRNHEVNKIVRTDANGHIQAGWINTTSGDIGTGAINKIYCSNDDYIRYKTPANFFPTLANSGNDISITVAGQNRTLTVGYTTNADKVDGYHANKIYNAPSFTVNNSNTSNTYILLATITISGTSLGCAEFTTLFQNRECLDSSSFILSGAIRRSSTTSVTATLSYITLHTKTPRNIYLRSDDGVTFRVYIQSATGTYTTFYRAIPIVDSENITYSNTGTTSPISGSVLNITATKGGNTNYANSAGNADTLDNYHANGLLTALSNSNNGVSITVGGTTKSISNISVNYANSAGSASSATKVIVNQHTTNDVNYPLVWSNQANSNTITENQLFKSWSDLYYNPKNKRLTVGGSVVASSFIKNGGTSQQLLRADGGIATFNWSGQSGQPTWLWGGNNQHSYYVYNPSNFRVAYASSAGNADTVDGYHASSFATSSHTHSYITIPTCSSLDENSNNFSVEYAGGNNSVATKPSGVDAFGVMRLRTAGGWYGQILMSNSNGIYYRSANGLTSSIGWIKLLDSSNSSVSGGGSAWGSSITVKINGTSKTLTIPGNPNTDYRVTQSETTTANYRPLVVGYTNVSTAGSGMTGSVTNQVYLSNKFYVQPSTGNLYATNFVGTLQGNALTATNADKVDGYHFSDLENRYVNVTGDTMTGDLTITGINFQDTDGLKPVLKIGSSNKDTTIWRVYSNDASYSLNSSIYGYSLKYLGTGSGNNNKLVLIADNQTGTRVTAISITQDGVVTLNKIPTVNGTAVSLNGHTHSQYLTTHQTIYGLTIQANGTSLGTYTPNSAAKTFNITYANVGAAAASHTHNYAGSPSAGGAANSANVLNSNSRMDYGWNGLNYFNANLTAGCKAKTNDSPTSNYWHIMRFNHGNSNGYYTDLAIPFERNSLYWKRVSNGKLAVTSWVKVLDSLNYNEYAPTKTGGGASGTWGISISGNAATTTKLQTARTLWGQSFNGSANVSGNMSSVGQITFSTLSGTNGRALLYQQMADNDFFRIYVGGTASDAGYAEIATADGGNEPIYVRQYTGTFSTLVRTLTLLDTKGNTIFPGTASSSGFIKSGSNDNYVLLGGGGHKAISNFSTSGHTHDGRYMKVYLESDVAPTSTNGYWSAMTTQSGISGDWWHIIHTAWNDAASWRSELALPTQGRNGICYRSDSNGESGWAFGSWVKLLDENNWSSYCAAKSHTHSYLPLSGGTMTGNITYKAKGTSYIGNGANDAAYGVGGALNNLVISSWYGVSFTTSCGGQTYTGTNAVSINCRNGYVYANTFVGTLSGNATSATKLATARSIFGKSFNGTANVSGQGLFYGTYTSSANERYQKSGLQIRENDLVQNNQSDIGYAPSIGFHWGSKTAATMLLHSDGNFYFRKIDGVTRASLDANIIGNASTATALTSSAGSATTPIYFSSGKPVACTYSLNKTVPSNAVFTDHTYNFYGVAFYSGNSGNQEHNANSAVSNGLYYYTSNGPATTLGASNTDGALYVQAHSSSWVGQIAQDYRNGGLYVRGKSKGTWTDWVAVLDSRNYNSYVSSKTHTHSVIINGVTKTIAATGGTAVNLGTYLTAHQSVSNKAVTLAWGTSSIIATIGSTDITVTLPTISNIDTKNTAGSTDTSSKIFLIGATSQAANPQTYSHDTAYVGADGCLYSGSKKVSVNGHTHSYLPLAGGTMNANARIAQESSNLYIGTSTSTGWVYLQDMASQKGADYWAIAQEGGAYFKTTVTASTFIGALSGNATTATTASKLGSSTVGSETQHFYLSAGTATASSATVGSASRPMYLKAGVMTACSSSLTDYLPLTGGQLTGDLYVQRTTDASVWTRYQDKTAIRMVASSSATFIQCGNYAWNDNVPMYITGPSSNQGSTLYLKFSTVDASGNILASHFYENSDIRYKRILKNLLINSNTIANLPLFDFEWIENNTIGTGTSAQAVQKILPNIVSGNEKLTLDYGVLGTIAGITACKELVMQKSELQQLKEKVKQLEDKLRKYENI